MKIIRALVLLLIFTSIFSSCSNEEEITNYQATIDSLKYVLSEYKEHDENKQEILEEFNTKLDDFEGLQDSMKTVELEIEKLKADIRKKGYAATRLTLDNLGVLKFQNC